MPCTCLMGNPVECSYCLPAAVNSVSCGPLHLLEELHVHDMQYWQTHTTLAFFLIFALDP